MERSNFFLKATREGGESGVGNSQQVFGRFTSKQTRTLRVSTELPIKMKLNEARRLKSDRLTALKTVYSPAHHA